MQSAVAELLQRAIEPPWLYAIAATVFGLGAALYALVRYRQLHKPIVPFKSADGSVQIAPHTLKSLIQFAALSVHGVEKAASRHFPKRNRIAIDIAIHLHANSKLPLVEQSIKQRVRAALDEQFGMQAIDPITIKVVKVVGEPSSASFKDYSPTSAASQKPERSIPSALAAEPIASEAPQADPFDMDSGPKA